MSVVGIGLRATLKTRKLLILLNEKNAKNTGFAQARYTAGGAEHHQIYASTNVRKTLDSIADA
jgi:hypothetical protein